MGRGPGGERAAFHVARWGGEGLAVCVRVPAAWALWSQGA